MYFLLNAVNPAAELNQRSFSFTDVDNYYRAANLLKVNTAVWSFYNFFVDEITNYGHENCVIVTKLDESAKVIGKMINRTVWLT